MKKRRELTMFENTRIHFDEVDKLGFFLELEVKLKAEDSVEKGIETANLILQHLKLENAEQIPTAYVDLLVN